MVKVWRGAKDDQETCMPHLELLQHSLLPRCRHALHGQTLATVKDTTAAPPAPAPAPAAAALSGDASQPSVSLTGAYEVE